jgi:hypothetical protein
LKGKPLNYSIDTVMDTETGQMVYDLLAPYGQHLVVLAESIQNKAENKKIISIVGLVGIDVNYEAVVVLYKHLTKLLEEGAIKVSTIIYLLAFDVPDSWCCSA